MPFGQLVRLSRHGFTRYLRIEPKSVRAVDQDRIQICYDAEHFFYRPLGRTSLSLLPIL